MKTWKLIVLAATALAAPAAANDTTAVLKAGGLVYTRQDNVAMESEDLFISPSEVRVDYVFRNEGATDLETMVAFPMPDIGGGLSFMGGIDDLESANFMGFSVAQDGKAIEPTLQQRAVVNGIDVTEDIRKQGVSLLPMSAATKTAADALPADIQHDWEVKGLILNVADTTVAGTPPDFYPMWTLQTAYWWRTVFPAGKAVKVAHRYRPSVGGTVAMTFINAGKPSDYFNEYKQRYCLDDAFMKTAAKLEKLQDYDKGVFFVEKWLSYILTTGANWSGPIKSFRLTIDKGSKDDFVSFCGTGVRKTGPTTFEMTATDFMPEKDIDILLIGPARQQ